MGQKGTKGMKKERLSEMGTTQLWIGNNAVESSEQPSYETGLRRAQQDLVAGAKKVCGGRQNILWRAPKTCNLYFVFVSDNYQVRCKDTKWKVEMQEK